MHCKTVFGIIYEHNSCTKGTYLCSLQTKSLSCSKYRIALIFRGSKFSRIAALKEFVEKISQIRVAHV